MIFLRGFHISRKMTKKLQKITRYYSQYGDCEAVVKYIDFHIESWFTCIKIAGVQPPIIMLNKQFETLFWYTKLEEQDCYILMKPAFLFSEKIGGSGFLGQILICYWSYETAGVIKYLKKYLKRLCRHSNL